QIAGNGSTFQAFIWKNVGGVFNLLAAGQVLTSGTGKLEFETVGPSLKLLFKDQVVAFADDSSLLAAGSVGMLLGPSAALANFQATAVTVSTATLPFNDDFSSPSDGSQLSRSWTDQAGNVTIASGQATGVGGLNLSTLNGLSTSDVAVQA